jgi:hypothetical protein
VQEILCQPRISQIVELHACRRIKLAGFESDVLKFFTVLFRFLLLLFYFECQDLGVLLKLNEQGKKVGGGGSSSMYELRLSAADRVAA